MSETAPLPDSPPVKKPKWYQRVSSVIGFLITLWLFVGIRGLLLQDIPLLLFVLFFAVLMFRPIARWVGLPPRSYRGGCLHALWVITVVVFI